MLRSRRHQEGYVYHREARLPASPSATTQLVLLCAQITLKNPWAKVIDTITAKNTGSSDLSEFVACYPEQLASRIALIKVGMQLTPTTGLSSDLGLLVGSSTNNWWVLQQPCRC